MTTRPDLLALVTGTGTEVGKTWTAAAVVVELRRRDVTVAARKPAQSFDVADGATDADVLATATGAAALDVCPAPRWYERAMAPPMAADVLGRAPFTIADLAAELAWPDGIAVGIVEGAGGPRSPLAGDGDTVSLAHALAPDLIVLVADAGLGTINAVLLSVAPLAPIAPIVVVLNRYDDTDDLHARNRVWLEHRFTPDARLTVVTSAVAVADQLVSRIPDPVAPQRPKRSRARNHHPTAGR